MQEPPFDPSEPKATYPPGDDTTPGWGQSWGWNWTPDSASSSATPTWVGLPPTEKPVAPAPPPPRVRRARTGPRVLPVLLVIGYIAMRVVGAGVFSHSTNITGTTPPVRVTMNGPALAALPDSIGPYHRLGTAQANEFRARVTKQARTNGREADAAIYANHADGLGFILTVWSGTSADSVEEYLRTVATKMPTLRIDQMQTATNPKATYACAPVAGHEPGSICVWASATEIGYLRAYTTTGDAVDRIRSLHDAYAGGAATSPG